MTNTPNPQEPLAVLKSQSGAALGVNMRLLGAVLSAGAGWALWPTDYAWWGFGLYAIILWLAAAAAIVSAIKLIVKTHQRDKALSDIADLHSRPKTATLADRDTIDEAGMY